MSKQPELFSPLLGRFCPIALMDSFSLKFHMTSFNRTAGDYIAVASIYYSGKRMNAAPIPVGTIKPGEMLAVHQEDVFKKAGLQDQPNGQTRMVIIHMVPKDYVDSTKAYDAPLSMPLNALFAQQKGSDCFVDYLDSTGVPAMAVGYQGPLINRVRQNAAEPNSCLFQGAKCIVSKHHRSYVLNYNFAPYLDYTDAARAVISVYDEKGNLVSKSSETVPAFDFRLIEIGAGLNQTETPSFLNIIGTALDVGLLPFSIVENTKNKTYFIEHGVVPTRYIIGVSPKQRYSAVQFIQDSL
ncbi:hypothetical protein K2X30_10815 [bacterium]|nr:hypothetical protein [bacterium]